MDCKLHSASRLAPHRRNAAALRRAAANRRRSILPCRVLSALAMPATTLPSSSACFHAPPPLAGERRRLLRIHAPAPASLAACRLRCLAPQTRSLSSFGAPADPAISTCPSPPPPTRRHPPRHRPRASPRDPVPRLPHQAPDFPSPAQALLARGPLHSRRGGIRSNASLGIPSPMPWPGTSSSTSFSGKAISKRIGEMRTRRPITSPTPSCSLIAAGRGTQKRCSRDFNKPLLLSRLFLLAAVRLEPCPSFCSCLLSRLSQVASPPRPCGFFFSTMGKARISSLKATKLHSFKVQNRKEEILPPMERLANLSRSQQYF